MLITPPVLLYSRFVTTTLHPGTFCTTPTHCIQLRVTTFGRWKLGKWRSFCWMYFPV